MVKQEDSQGGAKAKEKTPSASIKRPSRKKPKDKPKRPLSAYNFFFKEEREKILKIVLAEDPKDVDNDPESDDYLEPKVVEGLKKDGGKVSFEAMGKLIGQRWKNIDPDRLSKYSEMAAEDTERYKKEMTSYNGRQEAKMRSEALKPPAWNGGKADSMQGYGKPQGDGGGRGVVQSGGDPYGASMAAAGMNPFAGHAAAAASMGAGYGNPYAGMEAAYGASAFGMSQAMAGSMYGGYGGYGGMDAGQGMAGYGRQGGVSQGAAAQYNQMMAGAAGLQQMGYGGSAMDPYAQAGMQGMDPRGAVSAYGHGHPGDQMGGYGGAQGYGGAGDPQAGGWGGQ